MNREIISRENAAAIAGWAYVLICWAVLVCCVVGIVYVVTRPGPGMPEVPSPPSTTILDGPATGQTDLQRRREFFKREVVPVIGEADVANRAAADRCIKRLEDTFDKYRKGVRPIVSDLTSWGTRWGVLTRTPGDWWNEGNEVERFISRKFEKRLFSKESLQDDIESALATFRSDVDANNTRMLSQVKAAVSSADLPTLPDIDYGNFASEITASLENYAADKAVDSVSRAVMTEILSGIAGAAAEQILVGIAARFATASASSAAAAGGAMAGGAAAGGGGGSIAGPAGTAAGVVVGLLVGMVIDWWMTSRFEEELRQQLNTMIDEMESTLVNGSKGRVGLRTSLRRVCDTLRNAYGDSFRARIAGEI